jgi:hypothetical protein
MCWQLHSQIAFVSLHLDAEISVELPRVSHSRIVDDLFSMVRQSGRLRTLLQISFRAPVAVLIGAIGGALHTVYNVLRVGLLIVILASFLIITPVALVYWTFTGFPSSYRYSPLQNPREIRLVQVRPGSRSDKVRCTLIEGAWEISSYAALNYAWGVGTSRIE